MNSCYQVHLHSFISFEVKDHIHLYIACNSSPYLLSFIIFIIVILRFHKNFIVVVDGCHTHLNHSLLTHTCQGSGSLCGACAQSGCSTHQGLLWCSQVFSWVDTFLACISLVKDLTGRSIVHFQLYCSHTLDCGRLHAVQQILES